MKLECFPVVFVVFLLLLLPFTQNSFVTKGSPTGYSQDVWVGVDIAYYNLTEFKAEVDEISAYTNLVVIGTTGITRNLTLLDETCQYVYDKGLSFIIYITSTIPARQTEWFQNATLRWGDHFMGVYAGADEYGGRQLDLDEYRPVWQAESYTDAADQFVSNLTGTLQRITRYFNDTYSFPIVFSDYALYWFDYKAGANTIYAEFGWNYSRQLNVALCRGAAAVHNKDWGVMITWTYTEPPYIESGEELYQDLILAYDNGAKYILIFDSNKDYTHGILKVEHLEALKQFWQYAQNNPRKSNPIGERVACVLPKDYGYGFRGPNDKIWGLWEADALSYNLCLSVNWFLEKYGDKLDIIYDDGLIPGNTYGYNKLLAWDSYIPEPSPSPFPSPSASPSPTLDPTQSPILSPSPTPPLPSPTSSPTPYQQPSPSPELQQTSSFPTLPVCAIAVIFVAFAIFVARAVHFAGKQPEAIVKPMKLTFQGMWSKETHTRVLTMGQGEVLLSYPRRLKYSGVLTMDSVTEFLGKVEGTLTLEGENGDKLFVHVTGTQLIDGSYAYSELSSSYRIWLRSGRSSKRGSYAYSELKGSYRVTGGTGRFQGASGNGVVSAHLTIDPSHQHGDLTDGSMIGGIVLGPQ
jgi:hypothetical protein